LECDAKENASADDGTGQMVDDELFEDALRLVLDMGQASSSMLQRRFRIGYTRAARLVDTMEELGIVGQSVGSKPREVILSRQEIEDRFLSNE
jgi:S-DNA-T family DNA segregation ATPase FtsK/SpoIIIE